MHAYHPKSQNGPGKSTGLLALMNLPDLPPLKDKSPVRVHGVWLRRVAVCFVFISLVLLLRSAWGQWGGGLP